MLQRFKLPFFSFSNHFLSTPPTMSKTSSPITNPLHFDYPGRERISTTERRARNKKLKKERKQREKEAYLASLDPPKIFFHAGKRCVVPYHHQFRCFSRPRWIGRGILDVVAKEFPACTREYLQASIRAGKMKLNGKVIGEDSFETKIAIRDCIEHSVHRHEPPVLDREIEILPNLLGEKEGVFAINKPSSIPVHPCGGYNYNSLQQILAHSPALNLPQTMQPVHRLDKLTSGVVIFSDDPKTRASLFAEISQRKVSKIYIALVDGLLATPGEEISVDQPLWSDPAGHKMGRVDKEKGKEAQTHFKVLAQQGGRTLMRCKPITGRTHQIRLHLQHLGHPIIGDPLYQMQDKGKEENNQYLFMEKTNFNRTGSKEDEDQSFNSELYSFEKDPICSCCKEPIIELPLDLMEMCLHSISYSGDGWSFYASPPPWAQLLLSAPEIKENVYQ